MQEFVRRAAAFRHAHPVLHQAQPLRMEDYRAAGFPDISYHSQTAWMSQTGQTKSGLGVLLCGEYGKKPGGEADNTLYLVYNMYWMPQSFALPDLPKGWKWMAAADTSHEEGFFEELQELHLSEDEGKQLLVPERCVMILTAVPETDKKQGMESPEKQGTETPKQKKKDRLKNTQGAKTPAETPAAVSPAEKPAAEIAAEKTGDETPKEKPVTETKAETLAPETPKPDPAAQGMRAEA